MELAENSSGRWANVWEATKSISCCGDWGRALGLLEAFVAWRLRLNHVSVNACINVARRGSGWHIAELLFDQFPRKSLVPDISSFGVLTSAYALSKQWWKALHSLLLSPALDQLSFNAFSSRLPWSWALRSLELMSTQQIRRDSTNHNSVISACEKSGTWSTWILALQCLAQLPEDALIPDVITYNASISACQKAYHGWRYTLVLLNRCPKPDLLTFNGSLGRVRWMHGLQLLQEMKNGEVQPDSFSLSTLIDSCGHEWPVALTLSQRFQRLQNRVSQMHPSPLAPLGSNGRELCGSCSPNLVRKFLISSRSVRQSQHVSECRSGVKPCTCSHSCPTSTSHPMRFASMELCHHAPTFTNGKVHWIFLST